MSVPSSGLSPRPPAWRRGRRSWYAVAVGAVLVLLTVALHPAGATPRTGPASPQSAGARYGGFSPDGSFPFLTESAVEHDLDEMVATGASWVRLGAVWSIVESSQGSYDWTSADRQVLPARARGLNVLLILTYTPDWARSTPGDDKVGPTSASAVAAFGAFARAAAARYGPQGVTAFEIWNEPNISPFWAPRPNPAAYTRLLTSAAAGIRAVNPAATIVTGGLAPAGDPADGSQISPLTFTKDLYANGAQGSFTALGLHPYSFPALPDDTSTASWNAFQRAPLLHDVMASHGDGAKFIWFTEFGAPTGTSSAAVSDDLQAQTITRGYAMLSRWPWAGPLFTYTLRDAGTDRADREQNFGLRRYDDTPKPAWRAYVSAMQATAPSGSFGHPRKLRHRPRPTATPTAVATMPPVASRR